ncbi:MAG: hypothetical protein LBR53_06235 [Deltaproteobacteria bacterium]|jgi:MraZ protein|nr:hypothetical protein [Deltaproteobacteria bacterium]
MLQGQPIVYSGEFFHSLDEKGRIILPSGLRYNVSQSDAPDTLYALQVPGTPCLTLYPKEKWFEVAEKWSDPERFASMPEFMEIRRLMFSSMEKIQIDKSGRILVPQNLRERAGLVKNLAILGAYDKMEIWDEDRYRVYREEATVRREAKIAEIMREGEDPSRPHFPEW